MASDMTVRVIYPLKEGRIVLRTDHDWTTNVEAHRVSDHRTLFEFRIRTARPFFYFKPCVIDRSGFHWSVGANYLAVANPGNDRELYPHFFSGSRGRITGVIPLPSALVPGQHFMRVYLPPGYGENTLKRYPVLYMHDGKNLFFPHEAFLGAEWRVDETMDMLDAMNLIDKTVVVGLHPHDRMSEYTSPGYQAFGRFVVEEVKPVVDASYRTLAGPRHTSVMGSSLGGVVSFHLAWQWPGVFGRAACLSSTFTYRDDLMQRVASEPKRDVMIYLDSGWPGDNYEVTRSMRDLLLHRGYESGKDLLYLAFPEALHNETHWAMRCHIPFQFLFAKNGATHAHARAVAPDHFTGY